MTCKQKWHTHVLENPFIEWVLFRGNNKVYRGAISFFYPPPSCGWNVDLAPAATLNHKMTLAEKPWLMEHWDRRSLSSWYWVCCDMTENSTASFKQAESIVLSQRTIGDSEDEVCHSDLRACEPSVIQTPWCAGLSVAYYASLPPFWIGKAQNDISQNSIQCGSGLELVCEEYSCEIWKVEEEKPLVSRNSNGQQPGQT